MADITYRDVKAGGIRLRVTEVGSGPPLLLLHSTLLDRTSWDGVLSLLAKDFRVVAPDLPGFGESEKLSPSRFDYTVDAFRNVIIDLYAGLGLGRAHVLGHGLGGAVAIALAARSPELVGRLLLVNAHCYHGSPDVARRIAAIPLLGGLLFKQVLGRAAFGAYFRERLLSDAGAVSAPRVDAFYTTFSSPEGRNSALTTLRRTNDSRSVVAQLGRVQAPTLVIWGRHDKVYRAAFGRQLSKDIRGAGFELLDCGHLPQEELPARLASLTSNFCLERRARS